jgi:hypothetical protein
MSGLDYNLFAARACFFGRRSGLLQHQVLATYAFTGRFSFNSPRQKWRFLF